MKIELPEPIEQEPFGFVDDIEKMAQSLEDFRKDYQNDQQERRKSDKSAKRLAIISIVVGVLTLIAAIATLVADTGWLS